MNAPGIDLWGTPEVGEPRGGAWRERSAAWPELDVEDPRWQTRLADPLLAGEWFGSLPPATRSRYCLTRTCADLATGIALENRLSVALSRYLRTQPLDWSEESWIRSELEEEARHSEMFRGFLAQVSASGLPLPDPGVDQRLVGRAWERWLEAAVSRPELLFMLVLCGEGPITTLQTWYLQADEACQHPRLRSLYREHLGDEVGHVGYAREALARHLQAADRQRRNRVLYLAPVAAARAAQQLVWAPESVVHAFEVPKAALVDERVVRAGQELVRMTLDPMLAWCLESGVISERTAPLWQSLRAGAGPEPSESDWRRGGAGRMP